MKDHGEKNLPAASDYGSLVAELAGLLAGERDWLANLANTAALLYQRLPAINWVGFYLWRDGQLVLGPFQGKPACVRIARGRGVCGTAAALSSTVLVLDVHEFPGHIVCDPASASEIVVPLEVLGRRRGVVQSVECRGRSVEDGVSSVEGGGASVGCRVSSGVELPGRQLGVLDLDSPQRGRFGEPDRAGLEEVVELLLRGTDWPEGIGVAAPGGIER